MHGVPVDLGAMQLVGTVRIDVYLDLPASLSIYLYFLYIRTRELDGMPIGLGA